ncbi:hypothetical protein CCZ01_09380 [Helicobacter monodelphidis]|uniref:hypothetical protein n=1 Tax=Helicobacter sp. 15-1451 TaxID=2004995 RepID=UPI000DCCCBDC|nr:hypothetical protein [Helicobacter sp. 15-1451]RAX56496.1 hypothetical protein CCZ01_09380 [Helicobacter sp. 15-1451]
MINLSSLRYLNFLDLFEKRACFFYENQPLCFPCVAMLKSDFSLNEKKVVNIVMKSFLNNEFCGLVVCFYKSPKKWNFVVKSHSFFPIVILNLKSKNPFLHLCEALVSISLGQSLIIGDAFLKGFALEMCCFIENIGHLLYLRISSFIHNSIVLSQEHKNIDHLNYVGKEIAFCILRSYKEQNIDMLTAKYLLEIDNPKDFYEFFNFYYIALKEY